MSPFWFILALYLTYFVGELLGNVADFIRTLTLIRKNSYPTVFPAPAPKVKSE